jgi:squalene-hopene/tetraprenyl-beta-curcumene cyclase
MFQHTRRPTIFLIAAVLGAVLFAGCGDGEQEGGNGGDGDAASASELTKPQPRTDAISPEHVATAQKLINGGIAYLLEEQLDNGGWAFGREAHPALTAMALQALVRHPDFSAETPRVAKGYELLLSFRQDSGAIFDPAQGQPAYNTAIAVSSLVAADKPEFRPAIDAAVAYLKGIQYVPGEKTADGDVITDVDPRAGGVSYGPDRPNNVNLSSQGFWIEAMEDANVPEDDPAIQQALVFISRNQNLSETNKMAYAQEGPDDGGFIYSTVTDDDLATPQSKAGPGPGGKGLRSYGSMTYTGFKSLLYAGVDRRDPRVRGAYDWIRTYWRLDSNPNMPQAQSTEGLYYYYRVFAKALRAWGEPTITDTDGVEHNWREELIDALAERVNDQGHWAGDPRWREAHPTLATWYAVTALQEAMDR